MDLDQTGLFAVKCVINLKSTMEFYGMETYRYSIFFASERQLRFNFIGYRSKLFCTKVNLIWRRHLCFFNAKKFQGVKNFILVAPHVNLTSRELNLSSYKIIFFIFN